MSITLLYGCFQIETSVSDLDRARRFMHEVLGAQPSEQQLAGEITDLFPNGGYRVEHLDCGQATFQLNEPSPALTFRGRKSVHQQYLERVGPCVSNLNFYVDDIGHARRLLESMGAMALTEGPSTVVKSLADYGPDNTRPGGDDRPFLFMDTRPLVGFDLEIMEPNFVRFADQTAQYPCFVRPHTSGRAGLVLQRLRIAVEDLESTYANLISMFAPASRSVPYAVRSASNARFFRMGLGGIELEYCRPSHPAGPLAEHLARYGPGVVTIDFAAADAEALGERADRWGPVLIAETDLLASTAAKPGAHRWQLAARHIVGFDVAIEQQSSDPFAPAAAEY